MPKPNAKADLENESPFFFFAMAHPELVSLRQFIDLVVDLPYQGFDHRLSVCCAVYLRFAYLIEHRIISSDQAKRMFASTTRQIQDYHEEVCVKKKNRRIWFENVASQLLAAMRVIDSHTMFHVECHHEGNACELVHWMSVPPVPSQ